MRGDEVSSAGARMSGRRCLVTGGASGIGLATAKRLHAEGGSVVVLDRIDRRSDLSGSVEYVRCDVRDEADVERAVVEASTLLEGPPDVLVNSAGVYRIRPMAEMTTQEWREVIETNLTGTFLVSRAVVRALIASGRPGAIVNLSSTAALVGDPLEPSGHYAASKGGVLALTRQMAAELAGHAIRVNAVCPGVIETPMLRLTDDLVAAASYLERAVPSGRLGVADEVAATIVFLASHDASYVTGAAVPVDGGATAI